MKNSIPGIQHLPPSRRFPKGGWVVRYRNAENQTLRKTFETRQEAVTFKEAVRTDVKRGDYLDERKARIPFSTVAEDWYATTADLRPSTRRSYRLTLDAHLLPALGDKPVGRITPSVLRGFLAGLPVHLSPKSKRNIFRVLSPILNLALIDGLIRQNPTGFVKLPKVNSPIMPVLTAGQVAALAEGIARDGKGTPKQEGAKYRALVYFAAYTGCRAGEIGALRVKNLDLLRGRVTVSDSVSDVNGTLHFVPPKNGKGRTVALPRFLVEMLAAYLAAGPHGPDDFVFPGTRGGTLRHANFYARHFKPALERALPEHLHGFRFHDLRHTCASLLIAQGTHPKAVSERLGHSSIAITMDRYGHLYDDHEEPIMAGLEQTFQNAASDAVSPIGDVIRLR